MELFKPELLKRLLEIRGVSGDEQKFSAFLLEYVEQHKDKWKSPVKIYSGDEFQDTIILVFGKPKTVIFAHIDTIGFTVSYENNLIPIGSPRIQEGIKLIGEDSQGIIEAELMIIENDDGNIQLKCIYEREIEGGTNLTFKSKFILTDQFVQSPYLDNRIGVLNALNVAETLENGAIVFSTYEEHGGGSVGFLANFLYQKYGVNQALISDVTWVTRGIHHNGGVVISLRDKSIPRRSYLDKIINIAKKNNIKYQLEVESYGGSDGTMLQHSDSLYDWCFIGAPEDNAHSPNEKIFISDIEEMFKFYTVLMKEMNQ